jgi:urease accessory protein
MRLLIEYKFFEPGFYSGDELQELDHAVTVRKITPSSRNASKACGRRLAALATLFIENDTTDRFADAVASGRSDGNLAVAEGVVTSALGITLEEAVLLELRGASAAMLSAAVRMGRISTTTAQVIAASIVPVISEGLELGLALSTAEMRAVAPELDIAAIRHSRREARLFAT